VLGCSGLMTAFRKTVARPAHRIDHRDSSTRAGDLKWWQRAVVYEIAPISFQDSDGDGKGDLRGLINRIDYLEWLGIDVVWLTPVFRSPMLDFGYDIADFCDIDPIFGTLSQFDRLLHELHQRGIRLILDFVPNHTSSQHPWFLESRTSQSSAKRDWYVWADPGPDGGPPNNWLSRFGGSAWEWDEKTEQYYYHAFLAEQPDLNWRNPEVRHAMAEVLRFWMRRGVDGFRFDASAVLAEDDLLRDDPPNPDAGEDTPPPQRLKRVFTDDRPETMSYIEELRRVIDEYPDRVICGEVQGKTDRIGRFYGEQQPRLHLPLNFALLDSAWDALSLQASIDSYLNAIPTSGWPDWVVGGHDKARLASKVGQQQARIVAMLLLTLKGTPFFFAGDEIGMEQVPIPQDRIRDPFEKLVGGFGLNRDPERSPIPWDGSTNAGFTCGDPWLPMADDVRTRNIQALKADRRSLLRLYRELIKLRRREPALTAGDYIPLRSRSGVLAYKRQLGNELIVVALNTKSQPRHFPIMGRGEILLSTRLDCTYEDQKEGLVLLRADEGVVLKMSAEGNPG
jgi:alpha-glucosidase